MTVRIMSYRRSYANQTREYANLGQADACSEESELVIVGTCLIPVELSST